MIERNLYTPEIVNVGHDNLALIGIQVDQCPICKKQMIKTDIKQLVKLQSNWGGALKDAGNTIEAQCKRADLMIKSCYNSKYNEPICKECESSGKRTFICCHCKTERRSHLIQEIYGDPPDYLCKICYETIPAKTWNDLDKQLTAEHQYDWE